MKKYQLQEIEDSVADCQSVILSDMNFELKILNESIICAARVNTWVGLQLIVELSQGSLPLDMGGKYTFNFLTSDALFLGNAVLVNKITKGNSLFYVAKLTSPLHKKQQRNYFRLQTILPVEVTLDPDLSEEAKELEARLKAMETRAQEKEKLYQPHQQKRTLLPNKRLKLYCRYLKSNANLMVMVG